MIKSAGIAFLMMIAVSNTELLNNLRDAYGKAATSYKICKATLLTIPSDAKGVILGYKGAYTMMLAEFAFLPTEKYHYFKTGRDLLEKAIAENTEDLELRYIRYSVQSELPAFLGYNHKAADRSFMQKHLPLCRDSRLKNMVSDYLNKTK